VCSSEKMQVLRHPHQLDAFLARAIRLMGHDAEIPLLLHPERDDWFIARIPEDLTDEISSYLGCLIRMTLSR